MKKKLKDFKLSKRVWLRGNSTNMTKIKHSVLWSPKKLEEKSDGKMEELPRAGCCLGLFGKACGIPTYKLTNQTKPEDVIGAFLKKKQKKSQKRLTIKEAKAEVAKVFGDFGNLISWEGRTIFDKYSVVRAMSVNDNFATTDEVKIDILTGLFKTWGYNLVVVP